MSSTNIKMQSCLMEAFREKAWREKGVQKRFISKSSKLHYVASVSNSTNYTNNTNKQDVRIMELTFIPTHTKSPTLLKLFQEDLETTSSLRINGRNGIFKGYQAEEEQPKNLALMAFTSLGSSSSSDSEESQVIDKFKTGLGYDAATVASTAVESFVNLTDKSRFDKGYHSVPPPLIGNFIPRKPDLTFMDEIVESDKFGCYIFVPQHVLLSQGGNSLVTAGAAVNTVRSVNTAASKPIVNHPRTKTNAFKRGYSQSSRPFKRHFANKNSIINSNVNTGWVWKAKNSSASTHSRNILTLMHEADPRNKCYLDESEDYDGGFVSFGDGKGRIFGKGKIKTRSLDFDDVYFFAAGNKTNGIAGTKDNIVAGQAQKEKEPEQDTPVSTAGPSFDTAVLSTPINTVGPSVSTANESEEQLFERFSPFYTMHSYFPSHADLNNLETTMNVSPFPTTRIHKDHPKDHIIGDINSAIQTRRMINFSKENAMVWTMVYLPKGKRAIGTKWVYKNKKDERGIVIRNKARLVTQGYTQEERIDYDEVYVDVIIFGSTKKSLYDEFEQMMHKKFQMSSMGELTFFLGLQVQQKKDGIFISQDKYVVDILKKFNFITVKTTCTPMEPNKALVKDEEADSIDVHLYRSMIGSLMYLTASRPDITFVVCAYARFQVTPKMSHLHDVKRIFRYLKGQHKLGLWYPRDSPFDLEAFSDSDYAGASLDKKSTTGGCQFLGKRLISWQCKKQTIVANSTTEAEYVSIANCCGQVIKIHTDQNIADLLIKAFDVSRFNFLVASIDKKELAIPGQTATGKEFSNPLMAGSLPKTISAKNTDTSKTVNSVKQIHAIVDGKAVVISESSVRNDLLFDDEDGITCLTNDEIFENLALMGYEQLSTKLTFQKGSFSLQWKFLIHTILHCISSKSTGWNEFSTNLASAVICLAKGQNFNFSKLIFDGMLRNLDPKKFLMYPRFLQLFLNNQLKDLPEPFNDTYDTPSHTKKVFSNMARQSKGFSGKVTPLFNSMLVQNHAPEGEGLAIPREPQPTPSTSQPNVSETQTELLQTETPPTVFHASQTEAHIEQILPSPSTYHKKHRKTQKHRRAKKVTELPQTVLVAAQDSDNIIRTQTTTMPNDDIPQGMDIDIVPPTPHDSPLTGGYTLGSDEGRLKLKELIAMYTKLSKQVLNLEKEKDAQAVEILKLKQVKSFDDDLDEEDASKQRRTSDKTKLMFKDSDFDDLDDLMDEGMAFVQEKDAENQGVSIAVKGVSTAAPRTPPTTTIVFDDEDVTMAMAQTLIKMKEKKAKVKGVAIKDVEVRDMEETPILTRSTTTLQPLPTIDPKDKGKGVLVEEEPEKPEKVKGRDQGLAQIESDAELDQRLHEEELSELDKAQKEKQEQEEDTNAALAEEFDEIQVRMDVDHELAKQLTAERAEAIRNKPPTRAQVRNRIITYLKHMEDGSNTKKAGKRIKRIKDSTSKQKSPKKSKVIKEQESAESNEEVATDYEQEKEELRMWLAVVLDEDETMYPEILFVKANGNTSYHKTFSSMLRKFDRQDLMDLHRLVMKRFEDNTPEGYNLLLWGDLKVMFEPNAEDEIWSNQQDWTLINWKLYENCGVYSLLMDGTLTCFNMLVEKRYPFIMEMLKKMLNWKLEAEAESTMAFELLKFIKLRVEE
ncbi:uncharacterized mitochondrial protein-like protein [Tanacetum coccineum]|uniref:Uncharacterized mitochondrial protein-like protein n=1 Tax=Tanacetum coccineum TaxID=301880 RepID=A0ABQ5G4E0_9ASTR